MRRNQFARRLLKLPALILGGLLPALVRAQVAAPLPAATAGAPVYDQRHYWADIEVGSSSLGSLAFGADLHAEWHRHWLLTAGIHGESSDAARLSSRGQQYNLTSYQLLAGKIIKGRACFVTASAGLALLQVHSYVDGGLFTPRTDDQHRLAVGVPLQVQGYLVALRALGLGATATFNLNTVRPTASLGLALALGRLPTRRPPTP